MKNILLLFLLFFIPIFLSAQTITGRIVDQNGVGLGGLQVQLYSNPNIYTDTTDSDGSFTFNIITDIKDKSNIPSNYIITNNYPNPFNPKTRFSITLPQTSKIKIEIFNTLGQKVKDIPEETLPSGANQFDIDLNGLSNGIYFARINLDNKYSVVKKLLLLYGSQHLANQISETNPSTLLKSSLITKIDSIVVTGTTVGRIVFRNMPDITSNLVDIGSFTINTQRGTSCPGTPTVTYAGKTYNTVQIGSQCWLKENLDVGTMILRRQEQTNNDTTEKYCYNDDPNNCTTYGGLYQWAEAVKYQNGATNTSSPNPAFTGNVQGICPSGWHLPTNDELQTLATAVNQDGNALKAIDQVNDTNATNTSGFSALLAGIHYYGGYFGNLLYSTYFWSSTEYDTGNAYIMSLSYGDIKIYFYHFYKRYGFSVRCVKD